MVNHLSETDGGGIYISGALTITNSDYHLIANSQAIDKGNNSLIPDGITTDIEGNARIIGNAVDIGAYEYVSLSPPNAPTITLGEVTYQTAAFLVGRTK
jgi:hypothetical protein